MEEDDDLSYFNELDDQIEETYDPSFDLSYNVFCNIFSSQFRNALSLDKKFFSPVTFRSEVFTRFKEDFYNAHADLLSTRSEIIKELFIMYHISKSFYKFNDDVVHYSKLQFRSHFYYPNIVYFLIRFFPELRLFLQKAMANALVTLKRKHADFLKNSERVLFTDVNVAKTDVLYEFLGRSIGKYNPLDIKVPEKFYRYVFFNLFYYRLLPTREDRSMIFDQSYSGSSALYDKFIPTRDNLYRDVLMSMQVEEYKDVSPTMKQLYYNFSIFKNVIINNEFQSIYLTSKIEDQYEIQEVTNSEYKMLSFYQRVFKSDEFLEELKKIPIIYKLLKAVHLVTKTSEVDIKSRLAREKIDKNLVISAVVEELALPFKNILHSDTVILGVLKQISQNFVDNILSGEYINLQTLNPVMISQASFVVQLKKFIRLCLNFKTQENVFKLSDSIKLGIR